MYSSAAELEDTPQSFAEMQLQHAVVVEELRKSFGPHSVLQGVSFAANEGETVALIGSNGSGKSTLLRCCVRLIEPDTGKIALLNRDVMALGGRDLRRLRSQVGFVFQKHNLVPRISALSNVLHGAQGSTWGGLAWYQGFAPRVLRSRAMNCLEQVGLADFASRHVDKLSGGQSQRVAIARALMQKPKLILADEPVASLDPEAGDQVMALLVHLAEQHGITLLFSSHHLEHALRYAKRVIGLQSGQLQLDDSTDSHSVQSLRSFYGNSNGD